MQIAAGRAPGVLLAHPELTPNRHRTANASELRHRPCVSLAGCTNINYCLGTSYSQCMYVCMYNPRKLRGVDLYPAATGGPARAHSLNRFLVDVHELCSSRPRGRCSNGGGSTTHSQDGRTSQTRTACPTESPRRTPELLLFQSGGPPLRV